MNNVKQSPAAKLAAGVTALVMTMTAFAGFATPAQAASDVDALCDAVAALQASGNSTALLDTLASQAGCGSDSDSSETVTVAGGYVHHPTIDFEFTRNLYIGSRGNDVMMLQKVLNLSPATQVATTGAGSPGNETEYFGPATRNAVAKFQAANGISPAAGYFYPMTRAEMNMKSTVVVDNDDNDDSSSSAEGDELMVSEGDHPNDDLMPKGVLRFVVTAFEMEAGDDDVDVESVTVRFNGNADADEVIDSVVILDEDMNIVGEEENLDSDEEAEIDLDMTVEEGDSVMMYVAVNAATAASYDTNDGLDFTMDVIEVDASADVDGLPVSGADMTIQDNIDLGDIEVTVSHQNTTLEIGSEDEEFVEVEINANPDDSDDSVFVKSLRLKNEGNGDIEDLDNIYLEVDNDEFDGEMDPSDDDYLVFDFGDGFELEDGSSENFTVYADVIGGASDTFHFVIDENSDVYAESEDGYGMPIKSGSTLDDTGRNVTISAGTAQLSDNDDEEADEITVGDDIVLGMFDFEIEGEGITVDELTVSIDVTNGAVVTGGTLTGTQSDLLLEDVYIADADGNALTDMEDADGTGAATFTMTVVFDNVEFPEGDHEGLQIIATIADEVANGVVYEVQDFSSTDFGTDVEGDDSEEDVTIDNSSSFDKRTIEAANLKIEMESNTPSTADRSTTDDVNDVHMATIEFDARSSGEDIEISSVTLLMAFVPSASSTSDEIEEMTNCRLFDEDNGDEYELNDDVDGDDGETEYEFEFDDVFVVPSDENMKLEIRCDLDNGLANGDTFTWSISSATADVSAEGAITGNDENDGVVTVTDSSAATITIASAVVTAQRDSDSPDAQVVKFSQDVVLGITEVESDNGEATVEKVFLSLTDESVIDDGEVFLYFEGSEEDSVEITSTATGTFVIDNLNIVVEDGETINLEFRGDTSSSATGTTVLKVDSIELDDGTVITPSGTYDSVTVFEGVPVIELVSDSSNDGLGTANDVEVFEITIEADGEDVTVDEIKVNFDLANVTLDDVRFEVFENAAHSNEAGTNNETTAVAAITADGDQTFVFSSPIVIPDGDAYYFVLMADTTVSDDTRSVRVTLEDNATDGVSFTAPAGLTDSSVVLEDDIEVLWTD